MAYRGIYRKGEFLVGATYSADLAARAETHRKARPVTGQFLIGGPHPAAAVPVAKRAPLPDVAIEGLASTTDIDLDRTRFRAYAFPLLPWAKEFPPLLYKHDPEQIAGTIEALSYDARGNLRIRAHVTHEQAKRCGAFSIRGKIVAYELRDIETKNFHALVTGAEIVEVSLTDSPANPNALVQCRYRAAPVAAYLDAMGKTSELMIRAVGNVQQRLQLLQEISREHQRRSQASRAPARAAPRVDHVDRHHDRHDRHVRAIATSRPKTEFRQLVEAINEHHC